MLSEPRVIRCHQWRDVPSTHLEETVSKVFRRGLVLGLIACTAASVYAPDVAEAQTSLKVIVFPTLSNLSLFAAEHT
jgi:hypothetical protein